MKYFYFVILVLTIGTINAQNYDEPASAGGTPGTDNTAVGHNAGSNGTGNTSVGKAAGDVVTGSSNAFFGLNAGRVNLAASNNAFFGHSAGYSITSGGNNTFLGYQAGRSNIIGTGNVFIGKDAGYSETGSDRLYIDNSSTSTPLVFGNFSSNQVGINSLPNTTHALTVGGTLYTSGTIYATGLLVNGASVDDWTNAGANLNYTAGMISIGTATAPAGYKLAIGGKVVCEEVVVKLQANWPDYVFETDYQLPTLEELQLFIAEHKHLPGIPAANEVTTNGVSLGDMNAKLLKKIEELTLYLIDQDKRLKELESLIKPDNK